MTKIGTKPINTQEVFSQAVELFRRNGNTSSKEVKLELRRKLFFAQEETVSEMMLFLAYRNGWTTTQKTSPDGKNYIEYSWRNINSPKARISIFCWNNSQLITNVILIFELIFLLILAFKTFEWLRNPSNENYEPLIGLIASVLAIFQWLINQANRNIFSGR